METEADIKAKNDLYFAIFVTVAVTVIQILGFYFSNSLALLSDTVHVVSDLLAMTIGFIAMRMALKTPTQRSTFGFHRAEVFSAALNGTLLLVLTIFIATEAVQRFAYPSDITPLPLLFAAIVGLIGNLVVATRLQKNENMNMHSVFLHVAGDALSSIGVIFGAIVIYFTGLAIVDSIVSLLIAVILSISAYGLLKSALSILFESAPASATPEIIIAELKKIKEVRDIHDVHIWSICSDIHFATAHVVVEDKLVSKTKKIVDKMDEAMEKIGISHATFQIENEMCENSICYTWHGTEHHHHH